MTALDARVDRIADAVFDRAPWLARPALALMTARGFVLFLSALMLALFLIRSLAFPGTGGDDGEQIVFAQYLAIGYYPRNPPLYAWLVHGAQYVFGVSVMAVSAVKFLAVWGTCAAVFACGRLLYRDDRLAALAGAVAAGELPPVLGRGDGTEQLGARHAALRADLLRLSPALRGAARSAGIWRSASSRASASSRNTAMASSCCRCWRPPPSTGPRGRGCSASRACWRWRRWRRSSRRTCSGSSASGARPCPPTPRSASSRGSASLPARRSARRRRSGCCCRCFFREPSGASGRGQARERVRGRRSAPRSAA